MGKKSPPPPFQNQRPPLPLEPTNVVDHESHPFLPCLPRFHEEETCARYIELNSGEANNLDDNYLETCNNLFEGRKFYPLSQDKIR
jgi:hypothetical protein